VEFQRVSLAEWFPSQDGFPHSSRKQGKQGKQLGGSDERDFQVFFRHRAIAFGSLDFEQRLGAGGVLGQSCSTSHNHHPGRLSLADDFK
jgi:hypothetical protein